MAYEPPGRTIRTDFHFTYKNPPGQMGNTVNNSGGTGRESVVQKPIPGPTNPGPPASMRAALARKGGASVNGSGPGLPNRNTSAAGSR